MVLNAEITPKKIIWRTELQCLFPDTITWLLKIIHTPCWVSCRNDICQPYHYTVGSGHLWDVNNNGGWLATLARLVSLASHPWAGVRFLLHGDMKKKDLSLDISVLFLVWPINTGGGKLQWGCCLAKAFKRVTGVTPFHATTTSHLPTFA